MHLPTGFEDLDVELEGGLPEDMLGCMVMIHASTIRVGLSSFTVQLARNLASALHGDVLWISDSTIRDEPLYIVQRFRYPALRLSAPYEGMQRVSFAPAQMGTAQPVFILAAMDLSRQLQTLPLLLQDLRDSRVLTPRVVVFDGHERSGESRIVGARVRDRTQTYESLRTVRYRHLQDSIVLLPTRRTHLMTQYDASLLLRLDRAEEGTAASLLTIEKSRFSSSGSQFSLTFTEEGFPTLELQQRAPT